MALEIPPRKDNPRFDDWISALWRQTSGSSTSLSAVAGQLKMTTQGNVLIAPGYGAYSPSSVEIASGDTLEIGSGSTLEIG